jgi:hypothetical protein
VINVSNNNVRLIAVFMGYDFIFGLVIKQLLIVWVKGIPFQFTIRFLLKITV